MPFTHLLKRPLSKMQIYENLCNTEVQKALPALQIRMETRPFAPSFDGIAMDLSADDVFQGVFQQ
jgi:hypothetical protein